MPRLRSARIAQLVHRCFAPRFPDFIPTSGAAGEPATQQNLCRVPSPARHGMNAHFTRFRRKMTPAAARAHTQRDAQRAQMFKTLKGRADR